MGLLRSNAPLWGRKIYWEFWAGELDISEQKYIITWWWIEGAHLLRPPLRASRDALPVAEGASCGGAKHAMGREPRVFTAARIDALFALVKTRSSLTIHLARFWQAERQEVAEGFLANQNIHKPPHPAGVVMKYSVLQMT